MLVLSEKIMCFQSASIQSLYFLAKFKHASLCTLVNLGFLGFLTALSPAFFKVYRIVSWLTSMPLASRSLFASLEAFSPSSVCVIHKKSRVFWGESFGFYPEEGIGVLGVVFLRILSMVLLFMLTLEAISLEESPSSRSS